MLEHNQSVLFVDDDPLVRRFAEHCLSQLGLPFLVASDAEQALAAFERAPFAVVLSDLKLPGMSGDDLLRRIKEISPTTDLIIVTAYPTLRTALQTFKHGAHDYLLKPIDEADLRRTIEQCLQTQSLRRDLTLQKQMRQKLEELNQVKSQFLANISHELRTPLQAIIGYADLLRDELDTGGPDGRIFLDRLEKRSQDLLGLVSALLDLAQLDAGWITVDRRPTDLYALLCGAVAKAEARAARDGLLLVSQIDPAIGRDFSLDPVRVAQIVQTLLDNAVKLTPHGQVRFAARRVTVGGATWAEIEVCDNRVDVSEAGLQHIFDEFCAPDDWARQGGAVLGLGAALCRRLVDLLDGSIEASPRAGGGVQFLVRLPLEESTYCKLAEVIRT